MTIEELEAAVGLLTGRVAVLEKQVQILAYRERGRAIPRDTQGQERGALYWPENMPVPVDPE